MVMTFVFLMCRKEGLALIRTIVYYLARALKERKDSKLKYSNVQDGLREVGLYPAQPARVSEDGPSRKRKRISDALTDFPITVSVKTQASVNQRTVGTETPVSMIVPNIVATLSIFQCLIFTLIAANAYVLQAISA